MPDDEFDRALKYGELAPLSAPLRRDDYGPVARWIGARNGAVLGVSFDADAEPGSEYDADLRTYKRTAEGCWEVRSGSSTDFPVVPGERPTFSVHRFPIVGLDHTIVSTSPPFALTYGIAAQEVAAIEVRNYDGSVSRAEVGTFGAVILGSESPPAEVVLLDSDGRELTGAWHRQIHESFVAGLSGPQDPPGKRY